MGRKKNKPKAAKRTPPPATAEGLQQAIARKDRASLRILADAFHHAHQSELALQALDALEALGEKDPVTKKRAQIFIKYGRAKEAITPLQRFLETAPEDMEAKGLLAEALYLSGNKEAAVEIMRSVVANCPNDDKAKENLAAWLEQTGRREEAEQLLAALIAKTPDRLLCQLQWPRVALERIPSNEAVHQAMLARFLDHVAQVKAWAASLSETQRQALPAPLQPGPFALAYYPGDITPYLRAWGEMMATLYPPTPVPHPPARERVRLVLFSRQLYRQSVWMILLRTLIAKLDTRFFELVVMSQVTSEDDQTAWLKERCARYYGMRPGGWEDLLQREAPDVLFLPDTAMNDVSVGVAARRFAPLQVTTWGHPVSSGLQTVDLYLSGEALEPADGDAHYIERLVRLPGTGACTPNLEMTPAPLPETLVAHFADNRPVALVPCNAFKLVPADDSLWVRLAQTYPTLKLLFFRQSHYGRTGTAPLERIRAALTAAGVDVAQQMVILEFQPPQVFATLLSQATLYLDVPSFSGYTTAWQGVFAGIPIVTLKGRFLRQRLAAGLLETIGCADTVVESVEAYIAKVGELIAEWQQRPEAYAARRARIQAAAPLACNDVRVVRGFERVLLEELAERGNPTALALLPQHRAAYPDYHYDREQGYVVAPPRQVTADNGAAAEPLTSPCLQELPMSGPSESDAVPSQFAPTPVHGLMPSTAPSPPEATSVSNTPSPGKATPPVWRLLDQDLHLTTLSHTYAPVGLLQMIPTAPKAVFDLGCFVGATGRWLKEHFPGVRVVGVELLPAAAEKARATYDQVFTGRFEEMDLEPLTGQFDTIIAADVLEHLYHPWQALERLKTLLAPGGALYVSLPNVRNLRVLEGLALGDWPYAGAGILDITHVRFFTRRSALRMLKETGWQVQDVRANLDPQLKGMIAGRDLRTVRNIELKNLVLRNLPQGDAEEFFTLQWFIRAVPE